MKESKVALIASVTVQDGSSFLNVGSGTECTIIKITKINGKLLNFQGKFTNDVSKPDGILSKLLDTMRICSLGWLPKILVENGLKATISNYQENFLKLRS